MKIIVVSVLGLLCAAVQAQTVYRCGPGGRIYQATPCAQGQAVDVSDPRSTEQRAAAQDAAEREAALAKQLERDRRAREAAATPSTAGSLSARPAAAASAPVVLKVKKKPRVRRIERRDGGPVVIVPRAPHPKNKP